MGLMLFGEEKSCGGALLIVFTLECLNEFGKYFNLRHAEKIIESGLRSWGSSIL